jgi:betaine-aldehyde dehydrogenase
VLTVETFRTEAEAVAIANDTEYGLAGAVWTSDASKAQRVAGGLRHGTVWINDYHPYVPQAEWGGFGKSGIGRELGTAGLNEYREAKHIWQNIQPAPSGWFGSPAGDAGVGAADITRVQWRPRGIIIVLFSPRSSYVGTQQEF